jgi:hyperosmotically inducible periplasmic protein
MKNKQNRTCRSVLPAAGLTLLLAMPAAYADRTAGETIDDSTVASSVKMKLIDDEVAPGGSINVEAYKGTVQLIGFVHSSEEKDAALERAKAVDGVEKVVDAMVVVPEKRSFGATLDDQTIQTKVKLAITDIGANTGLAVITDVRNGEVLLGGFVKSKDIHDKIIAATRSVKGVSEVHDHIGVKSE